MASTEAERIPTNLRTLLILETVGRHQAPISSAEIGREVGLPKQTIHRLCQTLLKEGFLTQGQNGLRPGRRSRQLATSLLHASTSHIARHRILNRIAAEIGETVNYVVPEEAGMSYKDRVETDWPFRVLLPVGSHVPFHCTASGKTYLASLNRRNLARIFGGHRLDRMTPNTITDEASLIEELKIIRRQGYALDDEEFIEGMAAIAVPVLDADGKYMASIGVHGPVPRFSADRAASFAQSLMHAAMDMATVLMDD